MIIRLSHGSSGTLVVLLVLLSAAKQQPDQTEQNGDTSYTTHHAAGNSSSVGGVRTFVACGSIRGGRSRGISGCCGCICAYEESIEVSELLYRIFRPSRTDLLEAVAEEEEAAAAVTRTALWVFEPAFSKSSAQPA